MEIMFVVIFVIGVVIFSRAKAAAQEQMEKQKRMQQQEQTRRTTHYAPEIPQVGSGQSVPGAQMLFDPTEGIPFHPPGFHGDEKPKPEAQAQPRVSGSMEKKPLEKADLGAERARQNAHTADNANWKPMEEKAVQPAAAAAERKPMYTAKQLRDAFIMQEILDEPVSRRKGIRRGYGS